MFHRHNVSELLGVGGPGDGWTSSGPGGMTSAEAQAKAAQPPPEDSFFGAWFAEDEPEVLVAEEGAIDDAGDAAAAWATEQEAQIRAERARGGGGGGGAVHTVEPVTIEGTASSGASSKTLLFVAAAAIGALVAFGK